MSLDRTNTEFDEYRLTRLLGQGNFGEVYLSSAVYEGKSTPVAVKVLKTELTKEDIQSFLNELRFIVRLKQHPNIVAIRDFGVDSKSNTPFIVMDYAPNGTLRERHSRGTNVPLATVVKYVTYLASALYAAHNVRLIHRDVKPENILLGPNNELLLSDFGLATVAQSSRISLQQAQGIAGTPYYMAPEQFRGKPRTASDQYALAVISYEWLCGQVPFNEGDFIQLGYQHNYEPVPSLRDKAKNIPSEVERVILQALAKAPKDRFTSVREFAAALEAAASSRGLREGVRLPAPPPPSSTQNSQEATQQGSKSWSNWLDDGDVHSTAGRYKEAVKAYTEGIWLNSKNDTLYNNRGLAYTNLKNYKAAIADFNVAVTLNSSLTAAYYNRGFAYSENKEYVNAIADFSSVIDRLSGTKKADSLLIRAYNSRGLAYYNLGSYSSEAVEDFKAVIARDSRFALAYFHLGLVYAALQNYNSAIENFNKALDIDSKSKYVYKQRGHAYNELKQYEKAIADFSLAINFEANDAMLYNNRGVAYQGAYQRSGKLGDKQKALADYEHALRIAPNFVIALENKKRLLSLM